MREPLARTPFAAAGLVQEICYCNRSRFSSGDCRGSVTAALPLVAHKRRTRFSIPTNPIGEECFRECHFSIDEKLIGEVTAEAAPWIIFGATIMPLSPAGSPPVCVACSQTRPGKAARSAPSFFAVLRAMKMPLTGRGLVVLAHLAFQEVKEAFGAKLRAHTGEPEYQLTAEDCHIVRQNFEYQRFDEFTYPSADLQLAAKSREAVERGDTSGSPPSFTPRSLSCITDFIGPAPTKPRCLMRSRRRSAADQILILAMPRPTSLPPLQCVLTLSRA